MFVFEFERALLRFRLNTPAFEPLFQLPPRIGTILRRFPYCFFLSFKGDPAANHAPDLINHQTDG